jgi:hypothetical protein
MTMKNRLETFATEVPDTAQDYIANINNVQHCGKDSYQIYDTLFEAFRAGLSNQKLVLTGPLDSADIMEYLKMRLCHLPRERDAYLLDEFWTWLSNATPPRTID